MSRAVTWLHKGVCPRPARDGTPCPAREVGKVHQPRASCCRNRHPGDDRSLKHLLCTEEGGPENGLGQLYAAESGCGRPKPTWPLAQPCSGHHHWACAPYPAMCWCQLHRITKYKAGGNLGAPMVQSPPHPASLQGRDWSKAAQDSGRDGTQSVS